MSTLTNTLIINGNVTARNSIIWLHGLGANANDFQDIDKILSIDARYTRIILPNAPIRPISINHQMPCPAWYDIFSLSNMDKEDITGIQSSEKIIRELIALEIKKGIPANHIILGGFSQGGAMALYTGLRYPQTLGGIVGLSTYLPAASLLNTEKHTANQHTPIFQAHGTADTLLPEYLGSASYQTLKNSGHPIEWHTYPMEHQICDSELNDLSCWLKKQPAFTSPH